MADPYAARETAPVGERPAGDSPLPDLIAARGGLPARGVADLGRVAESEAAFVAVVAGDQSLLPPLARIDPAFAVLLVLGPADSAHSANAALEALEAAASDGGTEIYLCKQGLVAGPAGRDGAVGLDPEAVDRVLGEALAGRLVWERDPDFGYEVVAGTSAPDADAAAQAPAGLDPAAADALMPRLTYAAADRVYEHAEAVATLKEARHRRAKAVDGLDPSVLTASGWPAEPTGQDWKD